MELDRSVGIPWREQRISQYPRGEDSLRASYHFLSPVIALKYYPKRKRSIMTRNRRKLLVEVQYAMQWEGRRKEDSRRDGISEFLGHGNTHEHCQYLQSKQVRHHSPWLQPKVVQLPKNTEIQHQKILWGGLASIFSYVDRLLESK